MPPAPTLHLVAVDDMGQLRAISDLFSSVWGRNDEGAPIPSEVLRAIAHAGGLINAAYEAEPANGLLGAAVLTPTANGGGYSMIAAAAPGHRDRGIGQALKEHQRRWAKARGMPTITWTFDPLVARNGHFNLDKLGARATRYARSFYGVMGDEINQGDHSDRLVVTWDTHDPHPGITTEPPVEQCASLIGGPDGLPAYLSAAGRRERWVRVPADIVDLRRGDPQTAHRWRQVVREAMEDSFAAGLVAAGVSRTSWYRFTHPIEASAAHDQRPPHAGGTPR